MRPSARTTGENLNVTPYSLNTAPPVQLIAPEPVAAAQVGALGMGISPPTVSFALSPDTAETAGSARMRETPYRSKACKVALKVLSGLWAESAVVVPSTALAITPFMANGLY